MSTNINVFDAFWQLPPMSRTFAAAVFSLSVLAWTGVLPISWLIFHPSYIWTFPPEIWRLLTSFLLTAPKMGIIFDTYFAYQYMSQLEMGHVKFPRKEDLFWYLIFVSGVMVTLDCLFVGPSYLYLSGLIIAMAYTVTQDQRGMKSTFFFFTIPAQLTPYCMMLAGLIFNEGVGRLFMQVCGLVAAHLHDFLTRLYPEFAGGRNLLPTPRFLSRLVTTPRVFRRDFGTSIRPQQDTASGRSTGASTGTGPLPDSWRSRGSGQRLGGD